MYKTLILFYLFVLLNEVSAKYDKIICTLNHTVEMESDTVVFFESPEFPRKMTKKEINNCSMNFTKALSSDGEEKRFVIFVSNTVCDFNFFPEYTCYNLFDFAMNATSYVFRSKNQLSSVTSFQGFAYFDDWNDDCPLESVSRINPFEIQDKNQIFVLRSVYDPEVPRKQSCLWQFKAPRNYGFKIVITHFFDILEHVFPDNMTFKVENSHETIITAANVQITYPYYTIDNYIKIYLSENKNSYWPPYFGQSEFVAYVTIIKNNLDFVPIDCNVTTEDNSTFWSYGYKDGYPNNARCTYILSILPETEVVATIQRLQTEENIDVINYYDYNNSLPNSYLQKHKQSIFAAPDHIMREILFEFVSDGSVQSRGFEVEFVIKHCSCAKSLIKVPCKHSKESFLMKGGDDYYCGNLRCNFTLMLASSCKSQFIVLRFLTSEDMTIYEMKDIYKIVSNNITLYEMSYLNTTFSREFQIPAENHNILSTSTTLSLNYRYLTLSLYALNISTFLPTAIINETKPYLFHDVCGLSDIHKLPYMTFIELSPNFVKQNASIDIFIFNKDILLGVTFYIDKNLSFRIDVENCFTEITFSVFKCKTNLKSFALVKFDDNHFCTGILLLQVSNGKDTVGAEGCVFKNNVFNFLNLDQHGSSYVGMSNEKKRCKIFCYSETPSFYIRQIFLSPNSNGTITFYAGFEEKLMTNIETVSLWHDLYLFANMYSVEIPLNSALMLTAYDNYPFDGSVNVTRNAYKTIIIPPNYGGFSYTSYVPYYCDGTPLRIFYLDDDIKVNFTVLDMGTISWYFIHNDTKTIINSTLHSFILEPPTIKLYCFCSVSENCSIRILVENIISAEPTTSMATTELITFSTSDSLIPTTENSLSVNLVVDYLLLLGLNTFIKIIIH